MYSLVQRWDRFMFFENRTELRRVKTYKKLRNALKKYLSLGSVRIFSEPKPRSVWKVANRTDPISSLVYLRYGDGLTLYPRMMLYQIFLHSRSRHFFYHNKIIFFFMKRKSSYSSISGMVGLFENKEDFFDDFISRPWHKSSLTRSFRLFFFVDSILITFSSIASCFRFYRK